jgi:predicted O-methyltransferase YrrM
MNEEQHIIDKFRLDVSGEAPYYIKISRWKTLPYLFGELGYKVGAEIGVETGKYSESLLRKIPDLKLYSVDCWETMIDYRSDLKERTKRYEAEAREKLAPYGDRSVIVKKYSMDAVEDFDDNSLDFVFIDGNHDFRNCADDIAEWSKKVRVGGIISGHDFCNEICEGERIDVESVVRGWTQANDIKTWFVTRGREKRMVWFFVKK